MLQMMLLLLDRQCEYRKTHFLVEHGDFVLPVSQRSDGMLRTDGSVRLSQLDVACVGAELEMHLGLDLTQGKLSPSLHGGGEHGLHVGWVSSS